MSWDQNQQNQNPHYQGNPNVGPSPMVAGPPMMVAQPVSGYKENEYGHPPQQQNMCKLKDVRASCPFYSGFDLNNVR